MKKILIVILSNVLFISLLSCSKSSTRPSGNNTSVYNSSTEISATVSIDGGIPRVFKSIGGLVHKSDTIMYIDATEDTSYFSEKPSIEISLIRINSVGTYLFENHPSSNRYPKLGYYVPNTPVCAICNDFYGTQNNFQTLPDWEAGSITIESWTSDYISGSFNAICKRYNGSTVQLTNGKFKGKLSK